MNCTSHETWLQEWLDGTQPAETPAAEAHRVSCATCREIFFLAGRMQSVVGQLPSSVPSQGLTERILVGVRADRRQRLLFRRVLAVGSLAASVLVAGWFALPYFRPTVEPNLVVEGLPKPPTPSLEESLHDATAAFVALTKRTSSETVENSRLLTALVPEVPMPDSQSLVAEALPMAPLRELQESVSEGIQPVTSSFRRATDLFLRYLPPMTPASE